MACTSATVAIRLHHASYQSTRSPMLAEGQERHTPTTCAPLRQGTTTGSSRHSTCGPWPPTRPPCGPRAPTRPPRGPDIKKLSGPDSKRQYKQPSRHYRPRERQHRVQELASGTICPSTPGAHAGRPPSAAAKDGQSGPKSPSQLPSKGKFLPSGPPGRTGRRRPAATTSRGRTKSTQQQTSARRATAPRTSQQQKERPRAVATAASTSEADAISATAASGEQRPAVNPTGPAEGRSLCNANRRNTAAPAQAAYSPQEIAMAPPSYAGETRSPSNAEGTTTTQATSRAPTADRAATTPGRAADGVRAH